MKAHLCSALFLISLMAGAQAQTEGVAGGVTEAVIAARGPHSRIWRCTVEETLPNGRIIRRSSGYTEMAVGLHFQRDGEWVDAREEIELIPGGARAIQGQHKVSFSANINTAGAIEILMPDGQRTRSHVLGIGIYDRVSGRSLLLAETKDSIGQLHFPNTIIYPDPFDDIAADLRYVYRRDGISQDVLLKQIIALPAGFNEETTMVEIWSEFVAGPEPTKAERLKSGIPDQILDFGSMSIGTGKAFPIGDGVQERLFPVFKQWMNIQGRRFLVEAVRVSVVNAELARIGINQAAKMAPRAGQAIAGDRQSRPFPTGPQPPVRKDQKIVLTTSS